MATDSFYFTQEVISKIIPPKTKQDVYVDTKEQGLILIVSSGKNRSKVFYLRKTIDGRYRTIRLGKFPGNIKNQQPNEMSLVEARNKAIELKAQISKGIDPLKNLSISNNQIDNQPTELTVEEFFDKYIEEHSKRKNKAWKNDVGQMNLHGQDLLKRKIATITRNDIQKTFTYINNNSGPIAANRFYSLLSSMFNRAIEWDFLMKTPTNAIEQNKEIPRARYIATRKEMSRLLKAIAAEKNRTMADFILMLLFTGARRGNVESMKWDSINFEDTTWYLAADETKPGETQRIHLVEYAITLLLERRKNENNPKAIWVFPSDTSKSGHIEEPKSAWKRICKLAGISDLRIHDLRRTHGSWMRKVGADREIIGEALGHKDRRSTERYDIIETSQTVKYREQAIKKLMPELNTVTSQTEIKKITDNTELNNIIESLQSQIKAQQKMIEELMKQIRN
ncbi:MAG: site-specific integrase [Rickettsia endosymbiont of Labidopullus appendiculatus]|nr:site-specific integrase [Rickettsia endosymbiont of Labidopullus appendiculatus]